MVLNNGTNNKLLAWIVDLQLGDFAGACLSPQGTIKRSRYERKPWRGHLVE